MGLDMYLYKAKRYKDTTMHEVSQIDSYLAFGETPMIERSKLEIDDIIRFYKNDNPSESLHEIAYWRKANQIHKWFVDKVQDGEDDCFFHNEVTKELLEELRDTCQQIVDTVCLPEEEVAWKRLKGVESTATFDAELAEEQLPTQTGFFFGNTDYDEGYIDDLRLTIKNCNDILEETDFEKEMVYYLSSW